MESAIIEWCTEHSYTYKLIPESSMKYVYDLCCHNIINEPTTDIEMLYLGMHYTTKKDYDNVKKYYLMAIEKSNSSAMNNLGIYYKKQEDYENMMKYYLMAIEKGHSSSMFNLGRYYQGQEDYDNMLKYYLMAIEKGHSRALNKLCDYYEEQGDYINLIYLYQEKNNTEKLLESLELYLSTKSELDIPDTILEIINNIEMYQLENASIGLKLLIKLLKTQIDTLDIHFKYAPNGEGFNEAKKHYYTELQNIT